MKLVPGLVLLVGLVLNGLALVHSMTCSNGLHCPLVFQDEGKNLCCMDNNVPYCCNSLEFIQKNSSEVFVPVGVVIVVSLVCTFCCCYRIPCCPLAKFIKRRRQGQQCNTTAVDYIPVSPSILQTPSVVYSPPPPPQYYPTQPTLHCPPPGPADQPAFNPYYDNSYPK